MASVAVVGAGAIGLTFAFAIEEAGAHQLVVCGRTPLDPVEIEREGSRAGPRARVSTDLQELADPPDWPLLAVEAHQTARAAGRVARRCRAGTRGPRAPSSTTTSPTGSWRISRAFRPTSAPRCCSTARPAGRSSGTRATP